VDAETDAEIRENLKKYMGKATVILISHRVTTLMAADNILVLEDGRVTAQGTHEQLAAQPGLYRTICEIQQGGSNKEEAQDAE
jgi:ATP-binding cassette subfamily B protein